LTAFFDPTPAPVSDIINLQVGDVIRLDHSIGHPLTIKVQHIPKFHATVGTLGHRYALQIVDIIQEENLNESFAR
jgi:flagellar motor switch protein FliM